MFGIHADSRRRYTDGMSATDPIAPEPRRISIRLPQPLWIGLAVVVLIGSAIGLQLGLPIYRRHVAIREIERLGGGIYSEYDGPEWLRSWVHNRNRETKVFDKIFSVTFSDREITDSTLAYLKELPGLKSVDLDGTLITDAGLSHLKAVPELRELSLARTEVSDAGLIHLLAIRDLDGLFLVKTRVSKAGVREMKRAKPGLRIFW